MDKNKMLTISICYVTTAVQETIRIEVPVGSTLIQAIDASGVKQKYKQIDFSTNAIGVFGKVVEDTYVLNDHDRIEIYRPLCVDPMQARRQRAGLQHK